MTSSSADRRISDDVVWFKSTYSGSNETECVEVAVKNTQVFIRDSKRPTDKQFRVDPGAWAGFVAAIRDIPSS
ncbi:DUF397 domain-containing protein [Streptomyces sp. NPDC058257]|uniref:DUF397 domain-containing protein n=1 Tax=Streptomyces sp. NPDC058257 TaxID=3346409 RepID=UPI0036F06F2A